MTKREIKKMLCDKYWTERNMYGLYDVRTEHDYWSGGTYRDALQVRRFLIRKELAKLMRRIAK